MKDVKDPTPSRDTMLILEGFGLFWLFLFEYAFLTSIVFPAVLPFFHYPWPFGG